MTAWPAAPADPPGRRAPTRPAPRRERGPTRPATGPGGPLRRAQRCARRPVAALLRVPASKVVVPELPAEFTPRPRSCAGSLDEATADQVIVVSAPAGFGQDPAAGGLGAQPDRRPETAWVSVDADDNDPRRLWSAVLAALLALPSAAPGRPSPAASRGRRRRQRGGDVVDELADALDDAGVRRCGSCWTTCTS